MGVLLSAVCGAEARNIAHPSLLFTPERVAAAKKAAETDTVRARHAVDIIAQADGLLERNDVMKMEYLALAWQWTGDKKYADKLRTMLLKVADTPSWANAEMMARDPQWRSELQMAHRAFQIAVAYDAIYDTLSAADRKTMRDPKGPNWWTSCVCMGGVLALAISNELPEAAEAARMAVDALPEWFDFAGDAVQQKPRTFDRAGGMYESTT